MELKTRSRARATTIDVAGVRAAIVRHAPYAGFVRGSKYPILDIANAYRTFAHVEVLGGSGFEIFLTRADVIDPSENCGTTPAK